MKQNLKQYILLIALIVTSVHNIWAATEHTPFIESLTGSINGNTLTLTATMNYDNIETQIKESVKYHWTKGGAEQSGNNNVFTDNNAFTPNDITWEVYATYTYNSKEYTTNTVYYTQTPPVVKLTGAVSGDNLNLTASCHDYNGQLTGISYTWFTYTYDAEGKATEVVDETNHTASKTVPALRFEEEVWHVRATYTYNSQSYTTEPDRYLQEATALPTLTVTKVEDKEQGHDQLVMSASLSPDYGSKLTNLKYHWSNNGVEQTGNDAHREVQHSFDTQLWRCWATFTYDGKEYTTNDDTYTYYSTLGHLNFHAELQDNGTILATLDDAQSLHKGVSVTYTWKNSKNNTGTGTSYDNTSYNADWVEFTATITQNDTSNKLIKYAFYPFDGAHTVVYINYTTGGKGNDNNDGKTPDTPVKTWKKAYSLLNNGGWDQNIIVIVNGTGSANLLIKNEDTGGKAATITGKWPWDGTAVDKTKDGRVYVSSSNGSAGARIGGPTRFKDVIIYSTVSGQARLSCYLNDIVFDTGVVMHNFSNLDKQSGLIDGHVAPHFHLQLYADQLAANDFPQDKNKVMQVTIKSGQFGRILASRIAGTKAINTYIIGRHDNPVKANITIDIQDVNGNRTAGGKQYTEDIAYIAAGLTQGMMWGDITMNIKRGRIATLVGGSQGNALTMGSLKTPVSTYCGRTTINVEAERDEDVVIENYCGGCQGRVYNDNDPLTCNAFFYGNSTLNMKGGTITGDIFASSAGISGLRSDNPDYYKKGWYTPDQRIPYEGTYAYGVDYLSYNPNKKIVTMETHNGNIDLNDTEIVVNISGGVVNNVYGGSYGYSDPLPAVVAPAHAGRLFGNTSVNISGGTVTGNVYAGGKGSSSYYDTATEANKANFLDVAQVYGNTNVTITGAPDIRGDIYGGGAGVDATSAQQFLDIAKVYGNTNVIFNADYTDDNPFSGNIYGGGAKGGVEGNTNVVIQKGVIIGNVFGGSQGQEGYSNKAKVVGTTKVVVGE